MPSLTASLSAAVADNITATASINAAVADELSKTADLDTAVADTLSATVSADAAVAEEYTTSATLGMRIVDEKMQLVALDARIVEPWEYVNEMADRNYPFIVRVESADKVLGIFLGDPVVLELHRDTNGDLVRCTAVDCSLCTAGVDRRSVTAVNFYLYEEQRVGLLVCDEVLAKAIYDQVISVFPNRERSVVSIRNVGRQEGSYREIFYEVIMHDGALVQNEWDAITAETLIDINSIPDETIVGPLF